MSASIRSNPYPPAYDAIGYQTYPFRNFRCPLNERVDWDIFMLRSVRGSFNGFNQKMDEGPLSQLWSRKPAYISATALDAGYYDYFVRHHNQ